jgi:two-component system, cell cycle response regulator DivK
MASILVVEDNDMNRDMLCRRLERRAFEVRSAVDGQQGVDQALAEPPDLILLDIDLPVMDGWEAISILKNTGATRNIPVIALTAHAMTSDRERVFAAGFDEYGTKPVEFDALVGKIQTLLAARAG